LSFYPAKHNGNGQFADPVWCDRLTQRNNQIAVADGSNHRIQVFDEKGFIRAFGSCGSGGGGELKSP